MSCCGMPVFAFPIKTAQVSHSLTLLNDSEGIIKAPFLSNQNINSSNYYIVYVILLTKHFKNSAHVSIRTGLS